MDGSTSEKSINVIHHINTINEREFPGGLVVRILGFHYCGPDSIPGQGTEILQAVWHGQTKKKQKINKK